RDLGDDDALPAAAVSLLDVGAGPGDHPATTRLVGVVDPLPSVDDATGRKVGAANELPQIVDLAIRIVDEVDTGVHHLPQVVRRDVGGHPYGDPTAPVDQEVGNLGWQHHRLHQPVVEVGGEIDRFL